jgi:polygalacturonase
MRVVQKLINSWFAFASVPLGDDCIAINNGSSYINISGIACGPGHGIRCG